MSQSQAKGEAAISAKSVAKEFLDFWQKETSIHFRKEEEVLLPVVARYGGDVCQDSLVEMLAQHACIRALIMRLSDEAMSGNVRTETLHEIEEQLEAHIRLEERVVFPLVEESLSGVTFGSRPHRASGSARGRGGRPPGRAVGPCRGALICAVAGAR